MKHCKKCEASKPFSDFSKDKYQKNGHVTQCKSCKSQYHIKYYVENSDVIKSRSAQWYAENTEAANARNIASYYNNIEQRKIERKAKYWADPETAKTENAVYARERAKVDPVYRLKARCRKRIWAAFKEGGYSKKTKSFEMIGCTVSHLIGHLEKQFTDGMTWDNYGEWHVDHKQPFASAATKEEAIALCHYTNLQSLWAAENLAKSARLDWVSTND